MPAQCGAFNEEAKRVQLGFSGSVHAPDSPEDAPSELKICLRSCSPTIPSPSWSMSENASRNCWIWGGEKREKTPEGSRRALDFCAFVSLDGVLVGVMSGDSP